jgi:hypothetical protein
MESLQIDSVAEIFLPFFGADLIPESKFLLGTGYTNNMKLPINARSVYSAVSQ